MVKLQKNFLNYKFNEFIGSALSFSQLQFLSLLPFKYFRDAKLFVAFILSSLLSLFAMFRSLRARPRFRDLHHFLIPYVRLVLLSDTEDFRSVSCRNIKISIWKKKCLFFSFSAWDDKYSLEKEPL